MQIDDCLSQWRKRFGEHVLEALEEITFKDLPVNDTAHRGWWCSWALTCGNDHCRPFYYAVYEPEKAHPKIKVCGLHQIGRYKHITSCIPLGYIPVASHCCGSQDAHVVAISNWWGCLLWQETSGSTCPCHPSSKQIDFIFLTQSTLHILQG